MQPERFELNNTDRLEGWLDEVWVFCPHCKATAINSCQKEDFFSRRLLCLSCGYNKDWVSNGFSYVRGEALDPFTNLKLVFNAQTAKGPLFAYNPEHLYELRAFISAGQRHRMRQDGIDAGWSNKNYFSRLPDWIKSAGNRQMLLHKVDDILAKNGIKP